ncbi:MAG: DUF447 domain-containing protein [Gammaproteobacteria bacterium]
MAEFIREAVVATPNEDGSAHLTPLGFRQRGELVLLAPFHPSRTLENLRARGRAVLNFTDDVQVIAGCLTGRREWPTVASEVVAVPRLAAALAHWELEVVAVHDDAARPVFDCRIVAEGNHRAFTGFNRAQAAVVEAAVMVSRLDWLSSAEVVAALRGLRVAVDKTAGERERRAWQWLCAAVAAHPRHRDEARSLES